MKVIKPACAKSWKYLKVEAVPPLTEKLFQGPLGNVIENTAVGVVANVEGGIKSAIQKLDELEKRRQQAELEKKQKEEEIIKQRKLAEAAALQAKLKEKEKIEPKEGKTPVKDAKEITKKETQKGDAAAAKATSKTPPTCASSKPAVAPAIPSAPATKGASAAKKPAAAPPKAKAPTAAKQAERKSSPKEEDPKPKKHVGK